MNQIVLILAGTAAFLGLFVCGTLGMQKAVRASLLAFVLVLSSCVAMHYGLVLGVSTIAAVLGMVLPLMVIATQGLQLLVWLRVRKRFDEPGRFRVDPLSLAAVYRSAWMLD